MIYEEQLKRGSEIFFYLMKHKIIPISDNCANDFINNSDIREIVKIIADEAGLKVFETRENVHLVSKAYGSVFANSYTHMKSKYRKLERKKHFYLANIIICIYLSEIDKEKNIRVRWEEEGVSYYKLEELVTKQLESWKKRQDEEEVFSEEWGIAVKEIYDLWVNDFSMSKQSKTGEIELQKSNTRYGFIHEAMKPLVDQMLIFDNTTELKIIPQNELYERINYLYHRQDRYEEIMELIKKVKEEAENAKTNED